MPQRIDDKARRGNAFLRCMHERGREVDELVSILVLRCVSEIYSHAVYLFIA